LDSGTTQKIVVRESLSPSAYDGFSCHPKIAEILVSRGVKSPTELNDTLANLPRPDLLPDIRSASVILAEAIREGRHIVVVGDFDCDGATGVAVAMLGLTSLGAKRLSYLVPNRFDFGYGLTPELVAHAQTLDPDVIVTVDNGISSVAGVAAAKQLGWQVVVTDHHLPGDTLPDADALVNPNLPNAEFPSRALAGVAVMFYLLVALRQALDTPEAKKLKLASLLDLVALGTVADVVPLDRVNRLLVAQGLARIRAGQCRPGIKALLNLAARKIERVTAADIGFALGPRINAAGRLDDIEVGIKCLLAETDAEAFHYAKQLDDFNRNRRKIEADIKSQADHVLSELGDLSTKRPALALYHPDWHQGVVGIVASRLKEQYHRPTFVFATEGPETLKGSGRSIPGVHLRDALDLVDKRSPGMILKFGGHAMAAGLSLRADCVTAFNEALDEAVLALAPADCFNQRYTTDGELPIDAQNVAFAQEIERYGPWGQAFEEPTFSGVFEVVNWRVLKEVHLKIQVRALSGVVVDALAFNAPELIERFTQMAPSELSLVYRLSVNEWQGRQSLQFIIVYAE